MKFCPECDMVMLPQDDYLVCRACGYRVPLNPESLSSYDVDQKVGKSS
ncbi:hypothetical protein [Methanobacterium sp. MBAC-LM]